MTCMAPGSPVQFACSQSPDTFCAPFVAHRDQPDLSAASWEALEARFRRLQRSPSDPQCRDPLVPGIFFGGPIAPNEKKRGRHTKGSSPSKQPSNQVAKNNYIPDDATAAARLSSTASRLQKQPKRSPNLHRSFVTPCSKAKKKSSPV